MTYKIDGIDYTEENYKTDLKVVKASKILREARDLGLLGNIQDRIEDKRYFLAKNLGYQVLNGNHGEQIPISQADPRRIRAVFTKEMRNYLKQELIPGAVAMAKYRINNYEKYKASLEGLEELLEKSHEDLRKRRLTLDEKLKELGQEHISKMHLGAIGLYITEKEIKDNPTGENIKH